jgi:hypothetical protein
MYNYSVLISFIGKHFATADLKTNDIVEAQASATEIRKRFPRDEGWRVTLMGWSVPIGHEVSF